MRAAPTLDTRLYRTALQWYPAAFRAEYAAQIEADYDDARAEAAAAGPRHVLWIFWLHMSRDLARSMTVQWVRDGWPVIATAAFGFTWLQFTAVASFWWQTVLPPQMKNEKEGILLLFMLLAVVIVITTATIATTTWIGRSLKRPRRR